MVKINNPLGDVKIGKQGQVVYQRKYGQQIRRTLAPKRAMPSKAQLDHRNLYRAALSWRSQLARANRRYLEGYCIANGVVDSYHIPLPWSRFALRIYLQSIKFVPDLKVTTGPSIPGEWNGYTTGDNSYDMVYGGNWKAQTFTQSQAHKVTKAKVKLWRSNSPGIVTVSIRATDGSGHPTGPDLCSGTTNGNTLTTNTAGEWREITLGDGYNLDADTKYAIVVRALSGDTSNIIYWRQHVNGGYPSGQEFYSTTGGSSWVGHSWLDCMFEVWNADEPGLSFKAGILHVRHPALLTVVHKRGELLVSGYDTLSSLDEEYLTGQVGLDVKVGDNIEATTLCGIKYTYLVR